MGAPPAPKPDSGDSDTDSESASSDSRSSRWRRSRMRGQRGRAPPASSPQRFSVTSSETGLRLKIAAIPQERRARTRRGRRRKRTRSSSSSPSSSDSDSCSSSSSEVFLAACSLQVIGEEDLAALLPEEQPAAAPPEPAPPPLSPAFPALPAAPAKDVAPKGDNDESDSEMELPPQLVSAAIQRAAADSSGEEVAGPVGDKGPYASNLLREFVAQTQLLSHTAFCKSSETVSQVVALPPPSTSTPPLPPPPGGGTAAPPGDVRRKRGRPRKNKPEMKQAAPAVLPAAPPAAPEFQQQVDPPDVSPDSGILSNHNSPVPSEDSPRPGRKRSKAPRPVESPVPAVVPERFKVENSSPGPESHKVEKVEKRKIEKLDMAALDRMLYATDRVLYPPRRKPNPSKRGPGRPPKVRPPDSASVLSQVYAKRKDLNEMAVRGEVGEGDRAAGEWRGTASDEELDPGWREIDLNPKYKDILSGYKSDHEPAGYRKSCSRLIESGYRSDYSYRPSRCTSGYKSDKSGYKSDKSGYKSDKSGYLSDHSIRNIRRKMRKLKKSRSVRNLSYYKKQKYFVTEREISQLAERGLSRLNLGNDSEGESRGAGSRLRLPSRLSGPAEPTPNKITFGVTSRLGRLSRLGSEPPLRAAPPGRAGAFIHKFACPPLPGTPASPPAHTPPPSRNAAPPLIEPPRPAPPIFKKEKSPSLPADLFRHSRSAYVPDRSLARNIFLDVNKRDKKKTSSQRKESRSVGIPSVSVGRVSGPTAASPASSKRGRSASRMSRAPSTESCHHRRSHKFKKRHRSRSASRSREPSVAVVDRKFFQEMEGLAARFIKMCHTSQQSSRSVSGAKSSPVDAAPAAKNVKRTNKKRKGSDGTELPPPVSKRRHKKQIPESPDKDREPGANEHKLPLKKRHYHINGSSVDPPAALLCTAQDCPGEPAPSAPQDLEDLHIEKPTGDHSELSKKIYETSEKLKAVNRMVQDMEKSLPKIKESVEGAALVLPAPAVTPKKRHRLETTTGLDAVVQNLSRKLSEDRALRLEDPVRFEDKKDEDGLKPRAKSVSKNNSALARAASSPSNKSSAGSLASKQTTQLGRPSPSHRPAHKSNSNKSSSNVVNKSSSSAVNKSSSNAVHKSSSSAVNKSSSSAVNKSSSNAVHKSSSSAVNKSSSSAVNKSSSNAVHKSSSSAVNKSSSSAVNKSSSSAVNKSSSSSVNKSSSSAVNKSLTAVTMKPDHATSNSNSPTAPSISLKVSAALPSAQKSEIITRKKNRLEGLTGNLVSKIDPVAKVLDSPLSSSLRKSIESRILERSREAAKQTSQKETVVVNVDQPTGIFEPSADIELQIPKSSICLGRLPASDSPVPSSELKRSESIADKILEVAHNLRVASKPCPSPVPAPASVPASPAPATPADKKHKPSEALPKKKIKRRKAINRTGFPSVKKKKKKVVAPQVESGSAFERVPLAGEAAASFLERTARVSVIALERLQAPPTQKESCKKEADQDSEDSMPLSLLTLKAERRSRRERAIKRSPSPPASASESDPLPPPDSEVDYEKSIDVLSKSVMGKKVGASSRDHSPASAASGAETSRRPPRPRHKYLLAGLFSDYYKGNEGSAGSSLPALGPPGHMSRLLPPPPYCERWVRQRRIPFTLPYDIWWQHNRNQAVPSWNYRKIRTNVYYDVKPTPDGCESQACNCGPAAHCGDDCINRMVYAECSPQLCVCKERCRNQRIQRHEWAPGLDKFMTENKGWGVRTKQHIKNGAFILEYVGEVVSDREFKERMATRYVKDTHHYCLHLDGGLVIDGHRMGGEGRFVNHSCQPNCEMQKWSVNGLFRMALFALRDIQPNEELTYDYNFSLFNPAEGQPCKCDSENCRGVIGGKSQRISKPGGKVINGDNNNITETSNLIQPPSVPPNRVGRPRKPPRPRKPTNNTRLNDGGRLSLEPPPRPLSFRERALVQERRCFLPRNLHRARRARERRLSGGDRQAAGRSTRVRRLPLQPPSMDAEPQRAKAARLNDIFRELYNAIITHRDEKNEVVCLPLLRRRPSSGLAELSRLAADIEAGHFHTVAAFDRQVSTLLAQAASCLPSAHRQMLKKAYVQAKAAVAERLQEALAPEDTLPRGFTTKRKHEEVISCVCGLHGEEGLMVQCGGEGEEEGGCGVWQHARCMGVRDAAAPHYCHRCRPRSLPLEIPQDEETEEGHPFYLCLLRGQLQVRQGDTVYVLRDIPIDERRPDCSQQPTPPPPKRKKTSKDVAVGKHTYLTIGSISVSELDIFRVERLWKDKNTGQRYVYGHHYLRPHETYHEPTRKFFPNEVMRVPLYEAVPIELVMSQCWVMDLNTYCKGRPLEAQEEHVYICELRVDKGARLFTKISRPKFPVCTKSYAFRMFPERLKVTRTYAPHEVSPSLLKNRPRKLSEGGRGKAAAPAPAPHPAVPAPRPRGAPLLHAPIVKTRAWQRSRLNKILLKLLARMPTKQALDMSYLLDGRRQRKKTT